MWSGFLACAPPPAGVSSGVGATMSEDDTAVARRAAGGDRAAFDELVRRTGRLVFARLYLDTGDAHRAEDLAQETFLLAFRSVGRLRDPASFRPWLLGIAHNVLASAARHDTRQKRTPPPDPGDPRHAPPADEPAERAEARERVLAVLRSLPDEYRLPLTLRYIAGADADTITAQLGLTNGSLRGLLHRGLKLLRERLPNDLRPDQ
jgi:RNA polymerase sigma-70 factor (ECF subfamily)